MLNKLPAKCQTLTTINETQKIYFYFFEKHNSIYLVVNSFFQ
ncbi:hypothetical protein AWRIB429_0490 [Oenococcus oeni AWRIB429]|uniref:Uncharacterized protein n=1 Tax=Oenococcus oeni AWRIB429 TaxID=655225 RepID=D3L810_OENOE|nr:hypothetical protein AWRIB429_0490 [Oenococcus oeni AWRIB429]KZD13725.1 hypothetical protein AC229_0382 [Oenococcus oeni]